MLDEEDLELIDALQVNPRVSWAELGPTLGVDPATVARRWRRLHDAGEAWVSAAFGRRQLHTLPVAFLELDAEAGAAADVSDALVDAGHILTIQHVAGSYDLWVLAMAHSPAALAEQVLRAVPGLPGVRRVRTHLATRVFDTSQRWRLRVLPREAASAVAAPAGEPGSTRAMDVVDRELFVALSSDGRASWTDLAERVSLTPRSVQRRIQRMVTAGDIDFRCDLARTLAGWHAAAVLWLDVPDRLLEETGHALLRWPETRTCAAVAGPANLMLTVGLHSLADLHPLVTRLSEAFPHAQIRDRQAVLRQTKLYGRVLDGAGRSVRSVPVDPWTLQEPVYGVPRVSEGRPPGRGRAGGRRGRTR